MKLPQDAVAWIDRLMNAMPYNFLTGGFHTKKNSVVRFLPEKCNFRPKNSHFAICIFELKGNVRCSLKLIGKRIMNFPPISRNETFSLGVTAAALRVQHMYQ